MRTFLFAAVLSLAAFAGCSKTEPGVAAAAGDKTKADVPAMTVDEVEKALASNEVKAVDCNNADERKQTGVVPGAILLSDEESYAASELPADKNTKLVFYCANEH